MQAHDQLFKERKFTILADIFFHDHELEIPNGIAAGQAFITADYIHFFVHYQFFNGLPEQQINPGCNPESKLKVNSYDLIGNDVFHLVLAIVWIIYSIHMYQPVNIRPLRFSVQNGINDLVFDFTGVISTGEIYQMGGVLRNSTVIAQFL